jgi:hypothetical protein
MYRNEKKVIDEYRGADFTRRLHIYLQFPDLRSEFMAIDQSDLKCQRYRNDADHNFSAAAPVCESLDSMVCCLK